MINKTDHFHVFQKMIFSSLKIYWQTIFIFVYQFLSKLFCLWQVINSIFQFFDLGFQF